MGDIRRFEADFLQFLRHHPADPLGKIAETRDLSDDVENSLKSVLAEFSSTFTTSDGHILGSENPAEPMDAARVGQEKLQVRKPPPVKR